MEPFQLIIDGQNVTVHAPDLETATGLAQQLQQAGRQGTTIPPEVYYQGPQPQMEPYVDTAAQIRQRQLELEQRGRNMGQDLGEIGRGMLTGAADTVFMGADDEIGGFFRGALSPNETVREAVDANRAFKAEQNPTAMLAGGLLAGVPMAATAGRLIPTLPFARGTSAAARVTNAAATGAAGGAFYGANSADGSPMLPAIGVGAGIGGALGPVGQLVGSGVRGVSNLLRRGTSSGDNYLNTRAAGVVENALARDAGPLPGPPGQYLRRSADAVEAERSLGMPVTLADTGGNRTRRLTRASSNASPDAGAILDAELSSRYSTQAPRMQDQLADITGMPRQADTSGRIAGIEQQARIENGFRYDAAYNSPSAQAMWTPRLQELTRSPAVQDAMRGVNRTASNDAALSGRPAIRDPFAQTADGGLRLNAGAVPNLEYWDVVSRNLNNAIDGAVGGERRQLEQLRRALLTELDAAVPEFRAARAGAAAAFGATDALEAGQLMARDFRIPTSDFTRAFNHLSPAEQDLFREGYSNQLMDSISQLGDNRNVVGMSVFNSPQGRERNAIVFGRQAADEIENTVRLENVMNLTRAAVGGNSTTAQQLADIFRSPAATAGAAGTAMALTSGLNWQTLVTAGLAWGARKGQGMLNEALASRIGTLLASGDPNAIRQAASLLASTPVGNMALRNMEAALSRVVAVPAIGAATDVVDQHAEAAPSTVNDRLAQLLRAAPRQQTAGLDPAQARTIAGMLAPGQQIPWRQ